MAETTHAVELHGITKRFPGVIANDRVELHVEDGEIHAICGENGAGKSTLMKILYGMQPADEGIMKVRGEEVVFSSPTEAIDLGIGMVHQHFMLADYLTVIENIILGAEPTNRWGVIDFKAARVKIEKLAADYGLNVHLDEIVENLEVGERQRVEIMKVLYRGAKILILDEPTAVLVPHEVEALFENMRELKAQGHTIMFIDHKLDEVLEISDTITVIRRGKTVGTVKPEDVTAKDLAELMVGSELPDPGTHDSTVTDRVVLELSNVFTVGADGRDVVKDVSFDIRAGEIVGVAGVEGNGQGELVEAILGLIDVDRGTVRFKGEDATSWKVRQSREAGMGYIPEDRHQRGLLLSSPLWENDMLGHQTKAPFVKKGFWTDPDGAIEHTNEVIEKFDVRTPGPLVAAHALSGGNQQKLIVGSQMAGDVELLLAAHPTRGIDVGAQSAVWEHLRTARASGLAVMLISADLDELIGLSDRLLVMLRGEVVAEVDPNTITPRELGSYMTGASTEEAS